MKTPAELPFEDEIDRRIANLVLAGESNKKIAGRVGIPEGTVKWRLHRLYGRLNVQTRTQFVIALRDRFET